MTSTPNDVSHEAADLTGENRMLFCDHGAIRLVAVDVCRETVDQGHDGLCALLSECLARVVDLVDALQRHVAVIARAAPQVCHNTATHDRCLPRRSEERRVGK